MSRGKRKRYWVQAVSGISGGLEEAFEDMLGVAYEILRMRKKLRRENG